MPFNIRKLASQNRLGTLLLASSMLAISSPAMAQEKPPEPDFTHEVSDLEPDSRVIYGKLENGLRYAVMKNQTPSGVAALRMQIDTGSLNETEPQQGLAHFLEHMAFNGSKNVPEGQMIKRLERFGLSFGADTNASTGFSQTTYKLNLPTVEDAVVNEAFFLMRETAENLNLDAEAIDRERGVIASEKRTRDSASFRALIDSIGFFTDGSGLTDRLPIGKDETIASMPRSEFTKYYEGYYRPENTFILFVGDVDTAEAIQKIEQYFGDWKGKGEALAAIDRGVATITPGKAGYYYDPEILTFVTIGALKPYEEELDGFAKRKHSFLRNLGSRILNRRMSRMVKEGDAPFLQGSVSRYAIEETVDGMLLRVRSAPENWEEAMSGGDQELRRALQYGFSQAELNEAIAESRQAYETAVERKNTRKTYANTEYNYAAAIVDSFSGERVFTSPETNLQSFEKYIENITVAEVEGIFRDSWSNYDSAAVYLSTSAELDNPEDKIAAAFSKAQQVAVSPPEFQDVAEFAYTDFGQPGTVVKDEYFEDTDTHLIKFANNVRLNFKQTDYDAGTIIIQAKIGEGFLSMPRKDEGLRRLTENLVGGSGVGVHKDDALRSIFAGKRVFTRLRARVDSDAFEILGSTDKDDLPQQLNLMTAHLTQPAYRPEIVSQYHDKMRAWYPTHDATPMQVAGKELPRLVRSGDERYGYSGLDSFLNPTIEDVKSWIEPQFENGLIEITVVGDVDKETVIREIGHTFGALPVRADSKKLYPEMQSLKFPDGQAEPFTFTHAGDANQAMVRVYWPAPDASDPADRFRMSVLRSIFRNRLTEVIREEMGATYSPGAGFFSNDSFDDYGYILASVIVDPKQAKAVDKRIREVGEELAAGNIEQDVFDRAVTPLIKDLQSSLESNGYWMNVIGDAQTGGYGLTQHRMREDTYSQMVLADVEKLASEVFKSDTAISAHILPGED